MILKTRTVVAQCLSRSCPHFMVSRRVIQHWNVKGGKWALIKCEHCGSYSISFYAEDTHYQVV